MIAQRNSSTIAKKIPQNSTITKKPAKKHHNKPNNNKQST